MKKQKFPFEFSSAPDKELCTLFKVINMNNLYGKKARRIEHGTFLINDKVVLIQV